MYEADDDEEWRLVISEVTAFMEVSKMFYTFHGNFCASLDTFLILQLNSLSKASPMANFPVIPVFSSPNRQTRW